MRAAEKAARPRAYQKSAWAVATVSAGPNCPRSKSTRMMGVRSMTSPMVAGTATKNPRPSVKLRVRATPPKSPEAACRDIAGNEAEASATPKMPRGNSITRSA